MTELDHALRTMLRDRARDIDSVPAHLLLLDEAAGTDDVIDLAPRRRHTLQLIAASVIAVLALAGGLVGLQHVGGHGPSAARSGSPQPSTTATPPVVAHGAECRAVLPEAWRAAFTTPAALGSPKGSLPLAVSDTGTALIGRDLGSRQDVVLVPPGGAPTEILKVPAELAPFSGGLYGNYAVVPLYWAPTSAITQTVMRLDVIDVQTGATTRIAGTSNTQRRSGQQVVEGAVVLGGAVYWDVQTDSTHGAVMKYDLGTGRTTTVYSGAIESGYAPLRRSAAGLIVAVPGGGFALVTHASLPPAVASRLNGDSALTVGTDGTAYAWFDQAEQTISWWSLGQAVRTMHATLGQPDGDDSIPVVDVAGPYVFYSGPNLQVIDTRSGAVASLPNTVVATGGSSISIDISLHHTSEQAGIVDTATLPVLRC